ERIDVHREPGESRVEFLQRALDPGARQAFAQPQVQDGLARGAGLELVQEHEAREGIEVARELVLACVEVDLARDQAGERVLVVALEGIEEEERKGPQPSQQDEDQADEEIAKEAATHRGRGLYGRPGRRSCPIDARSRRNFPRSASPSSDSRAHYRHPCMRFARRIARIEPSITLALDERAKKMRAAGRDVISMAVGEPDFPAPALVQAAAIEKVQSGDVRYTPAAGTPSLRKAVAEHLTSTRGTAYTSEEVTICHSAKHALSGAIFALVEEGDEVLVPLPAWASYFDLVRVAGATPVLVPPDQRDGVRPDLAALARAVTPRTRAVMINSPNNPSGYVFSREEIEAVARLAVERNLWIISDEIYRSLVYEGGDAPSPASVSREARARTAIVDGASK